MEIFQEACFKELPMVIGSFLTPMPTLTTGPVTIALTRSLTTELPQKPTRTSSSIPETLAGGQPWLKPSMGCTKTVTLSPIAPVRVPTEPRCIGLKVFRTGRLVPSPIKRNDVVLRIRVRELTLTVRKITQTPVLRFSSPPSVEASWLMVPNAIKQLTPRYNVLSVPTEIARSMPETRSRFAPETIKLLPRSRSRSASSSSTLEEEIPKIPIKVSSGVLEHLIELSNETVLTPSVPV